MERKNIHIFTENNKNPEISTINRFSYISCLSENLSSTALPKTKQPESTSVMDICTNMEYF